jgi:hypothetical protein
MCTVLCLNVVCVVRWQLCTHPTRTVLVCVLLCSVRCCAECRVPSTLVHPLFTQHQILPGLYHEILNEPGFDKLVQQILAFYDADDIQDAQQSTTTEKVAAKAAVPDNVAAASADVQTGAKSGSAPQQEIEMHSISLDN